MSGEELAHRNCKLREPLPVLPPPTLTLMNSQEIQTPKTGAFGFIQFNEKLCVSVSCFFTVQESKLKTEWDHRMDI